MTQALTSPDEQIGRMRVLAAQLRANAAETGLAAYHDKFERTADELDVAIARLERGGRFRLAG